MTYSLKSAFVTIQGEGANTGRVAVFLRFAGCSLWSGREHDRGKGPGSCSKWCDTDFVGVDGPGGGRFRSARDLAVAAANLWPGGGKPFVVLTGGEPLLQVDGALVEALHQAGFFVAVETNGTLPATEGVDWVCVSPKAGADLVLRSGDECKLVFPQAGAEPEKFIGLDFRYFYLQPMDGPQLAENTRLAVGYCFKDPRWSLSVQAHKLIGIP